VEKLLPFILIFKQESTSKNSKFVFTTKTQKHKKKQNIDQQSHMQHILSCFCGLVVNILAGACAGLAYFKLFGVDSSN